MHHFLILRVVVEWNDRDAVVDLEGEAVDAVVDNNHILQVPSLKNPEVLNIVALLGQEAVLPVQPVRDVLVLRVDVVQNSISIDLVTRRECYHLEVLIGFLQTLHDVGTDVDAGVDCFFIREVYFENDIRILRLNIIDTMYQCLVHVEDRQFFF